MPRRRMIDPEFWSDELIGNFKRDVRLFYIGLWNFSDDKGRFRAKTGLLKGQIFPYDADIKEKHVENFLKVLQKSNRIVLYSHDGQSFGCVRKFKEHQTISHPTPSKIPPPPQEIIPENFQNDSGETPSQVKLREVKLKEVNKEPTSPSAGKLSTIVKNPETDKQRVEDFLKGAKDRTGFGTGRKDNEFRQEVKDVILFYAQRIKDDWGGEIPDEKLFIDKFFPVMQNLMVWGLARKPKNPTARTCPTPKYKMLKIIGCMSKPRDLVAELVDAVRKQPKYLP